MVGASLDCVSVRVMSIERLFWFPVEADCLTYYLVDGLFGTILLLLMFLWQPRFSPIIMSRKILFRGPVAKYCEPKHRSSQRTVFSYEERRSKSTIWDMGITYHELRNSTLALRGVAGRCRPITCLLIVRSSAVDGDPVTSIQQSHV